jgi:hypothetical protein
MSQLVRRLFRKAGSSKRSSIRGRAAYPTLVAFVLVSARAWADADAGTPDAPPDIGPDGRLPDGTLVVEPDEPAPILPPQARKAHPAQTPRKKPEAADYTTRRFEPAGFPLIGGDSDIGVEFGAVGTLSYFADGVKPYRWNMDLLASLSVKDGPSGLEVAQQNYLWQIDIPGLMHGRLRLNPEVSYNRTINEGYFGLGNASSGAPAPSSNPNPDRYHEFILQVVQARTAAKVQIKGPLAMLFAAQYLYVDPNIYSGSVLETDGAAHVGGGEPYIYGTTPLSLPSLAMGPVWDSRDD